VNIYNLLRYLIKGAAQTGGMTKEQAYDAMTLIDELEKVSGFGHVMSITIGKHAYSNEVHHTGPYTIINRCSICHKERAIHYE
jgi:hypothetical protein